MKKLIFLFLVLFPLVAQAQIPWGIDSAITAASGSITGGTCTNEVVTAIDTSGVPTCDPVTIAMITGINAGTNIANDLEEETHATEHSTGGGDTITATNLASACTDAQVLGGNAGATGVECQADDDVPDSADFGNLNLATSNHTGVLPTASGGSGHINAVGQGFYPFFWDAPSGTAANCTAVTANRVYTWPFTVKTRVTIDRFHFKHQNTGAAGCQFNLGIQDSSGNVIVDPTAIACNTGGSATRTFTFSEVTLEPGSTYGWLWTADDTAAGLCRGISMAANVFEVRNGTGTFVVGYCANASVDGNFPATCGAITLDTTYLTVPLAFATK